MKHFDRSLCDRFLHASRSHPEAEALHAEGLSLNYGQLRQIVEAQAQALAGHSEDAALDRPIAVVAQRNAQTVIAMLACARLGLPFVVIDAAYPQPRQIDLLTRSQARLVIDASPGHAIAEALAGGCGLPHLGVDLSARSHAPVPFFDRTAAYLLFTSGTTGFPKGIATARAPLNHFVDWYERRFGPKLGTRFSMLSGLSHDPVLRDVFVPLSVGGTLCIPAQALLKLPAELFEWMAAERIAFAHTTPQLVTVLAAGTHGRVLPDLQRVYCGGDVLRDVTVDAIAGIAPQAILYNFYGTSETPQAMVFHEVNRHRRIDGALGRPIDDVAVHIVDEALNPVAVGEHGEIVIETQYLSLGYLPDPTIDRSAASASSNFLAADTAAAPGVRRYRTGDIGHLGRDGVLRIVGRKDDQVKIRGYRVDCQEVAASLERFGVARQAYVIAHQAYDSELFLAAFGVDLSAQARRAAEAAMPTAMVPRMFVPLEAWPLLPNGKVDRPALRRQIESLLQQAAAASDSAFIAELARVLPGVPLDPERSFAELGGDSLSYVSAGLLVEEYLGHAPEDWDRMPLRELAERAQRRPAAAVALHPLWSLGSVQTSVFLRFVGIFLVAFNHAGGQFYPGVPLLFVLSGYSLSRFQLRQFLDDGRLSPALRFIARFGVPAALWQIARSLASGSYWLPDYVLLGTLWQNPKHPHFTFWFLDVLAASILFIWAFMAIAQRVTAQIAPRMSNERSRTMMLAGLLITSLGLLAVEVGLDVWNGTPGMSSVGPFAWLWLIAFGCLIGHMPKARVALTGVLLLFAAAYLGYFTHVQQLWEVGTPLFLASVIALIWIRSLRMPKLLQTLVTAVASASLFIYITNYTVIVHVGGKLGFVDKPMLSVPAALLVGWLAWKAWSRLEQAVGAHVTRMQPSTPASVRPADAV